MNILHHVYAICVTNYGRLARLVPSEITIFVQNLEPSVVLDLRGQLGDLVLARRSRCAEPGGEEGQPLGLLCVRVRVRVRVLLIYFMRAGSR